MAFFWDLLQHITQKKIQNSEGYGKVDLGWNDLYIVFF